MSADAGPAWNGVALGMVGAAQMRYAPAPMIAGATAMTIRTRTISSPSRSRLNPPPPELFTGAVMTDCGSPVPQLPLAPPPPNFPPPAARSEADDEDPPLLKSQKSPMSTPPDDPFACA